jgi:glycosyltransferase involved in cell wall biosynthesis
VIMNTPRKISIAIPAYNEEQNIPELATRIRSVFDEQLAGRYELEVVVCENGSQDRTWDLLLDEQARDPRFKIVQLSRNFHMEGGMLAALAHVSGDACVIMSADLQDPPELIPKLIELWEAGNEIVYTVITKRHGESKFRQTAAQLFYWIINRASDTPVPRNASDFRLVDRAAYIAFNALPEKGRMVRATWGWLGFRTAGVEYERLARGGGESHFRILATAGFAFRGILGSSKWAFKVLPVLGLALSTLSFIGFIAIAVRALFFGVPFPGFGTIASITLLLFGLLFLLLGMLAEYLGMIFDEVRARPPFVVRKLEGFAPTSGPSDAGDA